MKQLGFDNAKVSTIKHRICVGFELGVKTLCAHSKHMFYKHSDISQSLIFIIIYIIIFY